MKIEGRIFEAVAGFAFLMAIVYGLWTGLADNYVEPAGLVALTLTGGLCLIVGTYMRFVARRIESRPEDDDDAEISDGSGELGFFSPGSYWPIILAGAATLGALALALYFWWLIILAGIGLIIAVGGLVFEYHMGPKAH